MQRSSLNYIIDLGLLISFAAVLLTGIVKFPILIRVLARSGVYLPSGEITLIHEWGGVALALFTLLHLALHWKWMVSTTRRIVRCSPSSRTPPIAVSGGTLS